MPHPNDTSTTSDITLVSCRRCGVFSDEIVCRRCEGLRIEALHWLRDLNEGRASSAWDDAVLRVPTHE